MCIKSWLRCANRAGGSGYALNALRSLRACDACGTRLTLRSGRPNGARRTGDALKTLYTLRPRRPDRAGNTLNALHALRPRRAQHILRRARSTAAEETARGRAAGSGLHSRTNSENDSSKKPSF